MITMLLSLCSLLEACEDTALETRGCSDAHNSGVRSKDAVESDSELSTCIEGTFNSLCVDNVCEALRQQSTSQP
jgi:hypothetical protein